MVLARRQPSGWILARQSDPLQGLLQDPDEARTWRTWQWKLSDIQNQFKITKAHYNEGESLLAVARI